jgi:hypothetical protein
MSASAPPTQAPAANSVPQSARPTNAAAVPVISVTPNDPVLQAMLAALNTTLASIHAWGTSAK